MPNSRSIPDALWAQARRRLVFYFAHRGFANAEDLAHDTLAELLRREDYQFQQDEDFLKICYGFASRVLKAASRLKGMRATEEVDESRNATTRNSFGLNRAEMAVFLNEVIVAAQTELSPSDWQIVQEYATGDTDERKSKMSPQAANRIRVRLHRARRKLGRITGWKK